MARKIVLIAVATIIVLFTVGAGATVFGLGASGWSEESESTSPTVEGEGESDSDADADDSQNETGEESESTSPTSGESDEPESESVDSQAIHPHDPGENTVTVTVGEPRNQAIQDSTDINLSAIEEREETFNSTEVERHLLEQINEFREENGLEPLERDGALMSTARARSHHMHTEDYYSHHQPGEDGKSWSEFIDEVGACEGAAGENIANPTAGQLTTVTWTGEDRYPATNEEFAEYIFESWETSPEGHRELMLSENAVDFGVGIYMWDEEMETLDGGTVEYVDSFATLHVCHS